LRRELFRISGIDLTRIDGINVMTAQTVIAEVIDTSRSTEAHFLCWGCVQTTRSQEEGLSPRPA
jgi:hypothetical protein